ncbi:hypothetical protein ACIHFE_27170 [Streptomyces sp. NPDC052396]|uniref:hypothetical protein n=1 Tax=Streptomyces sp. NPDC052396 TaxID=3365689 RepID=UPI0037CF5F22
MPTPRPPLLFLDVDGPLNPYAAHRTPVGYTARRFGRTGPAGRHLPGQGRLNPGHGPRLMALGCELCWATAWMDEANTWIGPELGLPRLPYVDFGGGLFAERPDGVHWKTAALLAHAAGRPFVWVDDEQTEADHAYVAARHPAPALLHHVDPRRGLADADFAALASFAASLGSTANR